eukprot:753945-Hanusia_phi.AAC.8
MFRSDPDFHSEKELMNDSESELPSESETEIPYHSWVQLQRDKCRAHLKQALSLLSERMFPVEHRLVKENLDELAQYDEFPVHAPILLQELPPPHLLSTMNPNFHRDPDEFRPLPFNLNGDLLPLVREAGETAHRFIHTLDESRLLMAYRNQIHFEDDRKMRMDGLEEVLEEEEEDKKKIATLMESDDVNLRFKGLQRVNAELWNRGVLLCDNQRKADRHALHRRIIAEQRTCRVSEVSAHEISELDEGAMRLFVSYGIKNVLDSDFAIHAASLHVIKSGVEYGDDNLTHFIRKALRFKTELKNDTLIESEADSHSAEEMDRDGIETLVDWEADLVQASKEKVFPGVLRPATDLTQGAILRSLEKELAEKDEELERTRRLTDRKEGMTSELLTENQRKAIMDQPKRVPTLEVTRTFSLLLAPVTLADARSLRSSGRRLGP